MNRNSTPFKMTELQNLMDEFNSDPEKFADRYKKNSPWAIQPGLYMEEGGAPAPPDLQSLVLAAPDEARRCKVVHYLLPLKPREASDPLLWARLAHVELWGYMRRHWPVEPHLAALAGSKTPKEKERNTRSLDWFLKTRYLAPKASSQTLIKHAVARLWWFGHMALREDGTYRNAWVLVYLKDIVERSYGRNPTVVRSIIDFVAAHIGQINGDISKSHLRPMLKELNRIGGNSLIPAMDGGEVWAFMAEAFEIICSARGDRVRILGFNEATKMMDEGLIPHDGPAKWNEDLQPVGEGGSRPKYRPAEPNANSTRQSIRVNPLIPADQLSPTLPLPAPAGKRDIRGTAGFMAEMKKAMEHRNP